MGGERVAAYKLNEIKFNGDTGEYVLRKVLSEKGEDGKYPTQELGKTIRGVILKMRWRLAKYEENKPSILTSEYDSKSKDTVVVFGSGEKGNAAAIKERYALSSQRVLYIYIPGKNEIMRLIVKASALSGDKNPNKEMGLFEYVDSFNQENDFMHEYVTVFSGVKREDPNPRKNYFAMTFATGDHLAPEQIEKIVGLVKEVHEKTTGSAFAENYDPKPETVDLATEEGINVDDIPF
jgi:hypothetical protein